MPSAQPMPSHRSHSFQSFSHNTSSGEPSTVRAPSRRENSTVPLRSALSMRRQDSAPTPVQSGSTPSMTDPATSELGTTFAGKRRTKSLSGKSVSGKSTRSMRSLGSMGSLNSKTGRVGKYRAFEGSVHDLGAFEDAKPRKKSTSKPPSSFPSNLARSLSTSASTPSAPTLQRNKSVPNLRIALGKLTRSGSVSHTSSLPESRPGSPSLSTSPSASPQKGAGTPLSSSAASIRTTNTVWTACTTISTNTAHTGFSALTSTSTIRSKVPGNPSHPFIDYVPGPLFAQAPRVCMGSRYADKALPRLPSDVLDDDDGYEDEIEAKDDMSNQGAQPGRTASTRRAKGNMPPVPRVPTMYASPATLARRASERERQAAAAAKSSLSSGPKRRSRLHLQVRFRNSAHRTSQASMIAQEWKKRQSALMAEGVPSPLPRMVPEEDRMSGEGSKGGVNGGVKDVKDVRERQEQAGEEVVFVPRSTPPSAEHPRLRETRAEGYSANERPPSLPPTAPAHVGPTRPPRIVPPALTLSQPSQTAGLSRPPAKYAPSSMPHSSRKPPSAASPPTARSDTYTLDVDIPSSRISRVSRYMGDWAWHADHMAEEAGKEVAMLPVSRVATRPSLPILARAQFAPMPLERMDGSPARPTGTVTPRSLTASGQGQMVGNFTEGTMKVDVSADDIAEAAAVLIMGTSRASAVPAERRFIQREASGTDVWKAGALDMQARCASSAMPRGDRHALNAKASSATPRPSKLALTSSNYTTTKFTHLTSAISTGATGISSSTNSMTRSDSSTSTASTSSISTTDSASSLHSFESVTSDILSSYASTPLSGSSGKFAPVTASAGVHARDRHRASTASDSASPLGTPTPMTASKAYIAARVSPIASRVNVPPRAPVRSNTLPHAADASVRSLSGEAGVEVRRDSGNSGLSDLVDLVHLASLSSAQYLVPFMRNNGSGSSAGSVREPKCSQTVINSPSSVVVQTKVIGVKVERPTVRADTTSETSSPAQMLAQTYIQSRMANGSAAGQQAPGSIGEGGEKRSRGRLNRSSSIVGGTVVSPARRQMRHGAGASSERSFGVEVGRAGMRVVREE